MKNIRYLFYILPLLFIGCSNNELSDKNSIFESADIIKNISINITETYQIIDGFGASDCWTGNYVGKYWNEETKERIAEMLFSKKIVDGHPKGIGLSMWRFNLGGGTAEQGDNSDIDDISRRAECFLNSDGSYDWTKQSGQQYFLSKAYDYGCRDFVLFSCTPPVYYTLNGKGYSSNGNNANIKDECYDDFAKYFADVVSYFKKKNILFTKISPVNEPQYNWDSPSQEGTGWTNSEIKRLVKCLDDELTLQGLDNTMILLAETADWEYAAREKSNYGRDNVLYSFFDASSENYVGNLKHVLPILGVHSYWTDCDWNTLQTTRVAARNKADFYNVDLYQTEWSMLGDSYNDNNYPGHEKASYMDIALYMSQVIYHDLTNAGVSSWSYWTSMDMERWNHKNRFMLIKIEPYDGAYGNIMYGGTCDATKTLWVLGNFSLFIRPGYYRVGLNISNSSNSFFGSAYISPDRDRLVAVYTNITDKSIGLDCSIIGIDKKIDKVNVYTTSSTKDLQETVLSDDRFVVPAKSVVTLVYDFE